MFLYLEANSSNMWELWFESFATIECFNRRWYLFSVWRHIFASCSLFCQWTHFFL